jgi:hypothetical protein
MTIGQAKGIATVILAVLIIAFWQWAPSAIGAFLREPAAFLYGFGWLWSGPVLLILGCGGSLIWYVVKHR